MNRNKTLAIVIILVIVLVGAYFSKKIIFSPDPEGNPDCKSNPPLSATQQIIDGANYREGTSKPKVGTKLYGCYPNSDCLHKAGYDQNSINDVPNLLTIGEYRGTYTIKCKICRDAIFSCICNPSGS